MREIEHARTFWPEKQEAAWPKGTVSRVLQPHPRFIEYPEGTWRDQDAELVRGIPPVDVSTLIFDLVIYALSTLTCSCHITIDWFAAQSTPWE